MCSSLSNKILRIHWDSFVVPNSLIDGDIREIMQKGFGYVVDIRGVLFFGVISSGMVAHIACHNNVIQLKNESIDCLCYKFVHPYAFSQYISWHDRTACMGYHKCCLESPNNQLIDELSLKIIYFSHLLVKFYF